MNQKLKSLLKEGATRLGVKIAGNQETAFELYFEELKKENEKLNLTSITDDREIVVKHFLDSLSCSMACDFSGGPKVVDIGTGAGFPGLPLKIVYPGAELTMLDSSNKKVKFLLGIIERLNLKEVSAVCCRAEEYGINKNNREIFDVVLARAVAPLSVLMEYALPLLRVEGLFVAQKSRGLEKEICEGEVAAKILGGKIKETKEITVPFLEGKRYLVITEKIFSSPEKYPRRTGIPTKRPLGRKQGF